MTTYNQLLTDIRNWTDNDEIDAYAPTIVDLAEARHTRDLRIRAMERRSVASGNGSRYLALPSTFPFLEMRRLTLDGKFIGQVAPEAINVEGGSARAYQYCIHQEIEFNKTISADSEVELIYYSPLQALEAANQTNWLVENAYPVYLYACLAEASANLFADERVGGWEQKYLDAVGRLQREDARGRVNKGDARVRLTGNPP